MDSRIWEIIGNHVKEAISDSDQVVLEQWLKEDDANKQMLSEIERIWKKTGKLESSAEIDLDQEWRDFKSYRDASEDGMAQGTLGNDNKSTSRISWFNYSIAAIVVLGIGLAFMFGYMQETVNTENIISHYAQDQKELITLPDQSTIWLNKNALIEYDDQFGISNRNIKINGEGFFDVKKNEIPFVITGNTTQTEVLGTAFSVKTGDENNAAVIIVLRGKVAFSDLSDPNNKVELIKGEKAAFSAQHGEILKSMNDDPNWLAWQNDILMFDGTPLNQLVSTLEDYFDIYLKYDSQTLGACHFTGTFKNPSLSDVMEVLQLSLNLEYQIKADKQVELIGGSCK